MSSDTVTTLILAGGLGNRLRTVVSDRPKPMADVGGEPFLTGQIRQLAGQGFRKIVLCVGHMHEVIQKYFGDGSQWGVELGYAVEAELLGTAGALKNAQAHVGGPFMVVNGDSYLQVDYTSLWQAHESARESDDSVAASVVTVAIEDVAAYGSLGIDEDGRIVSFAEKTRSGPGRINGGVYALERDVLDAIPAGRAVSIEKETFPELISQGRSLMSFEVGGPLIDIGTPEGYRRFLERDEENAT